LQEHVIADKGRQLDICLAAGEREQRGENRF
jgi:hypothetical protein